MRHDLIPYVGKMYARHPSTPRVARPPMSRRTEKLDEAAEDGVLTLFRAGKDTVEISDILHCTQAAAANALAHAKIREIVG